VAAMLASQIGGFTTEQIALLFRGTPQPTTTSSPSRWVRRCTETHVKTYLRRPGCAVLDNCAADLANCAHNTWSVVHAALWESEV
jgi:hypothetical protein